MLLLCTHNRSPKSPSFIRAIAAPLVAIASARRVVAAAAVEVAPAYPFSETTIASAKCDN